MTSQENSRIDVWQKVSINRSDRPILLENEHNLCVRDNVGLYQGKLKIINRQNGRIYLSNKRIIYLDNKDKGLSVSVNLNDVSLAILVEKFLRSSPKVKVFLKSDKPVQTQNPGIDEIPEKLCDWVCMICSFNNQVSNKVDLEEDIPSCGSCGVKASKALIKRAISKVEKGSKAPTPIPAVVKQQEFSSPSPPPTETKDSQCGKCTFINHPLMKYCEMCGSELRSGLPIELLKRLQISQDVLQVEPRYNNPLNIKLENDTEVYTNISPYIKLSFRKGGEVEFCQLLNEALDTIKWDRLVSKGMVNEDAVKLEPARRQEEKIRGTGIHSLERLGEQQRKQNEFILTSSLEDLEQLMYKAQDLIKLSSSFSRLIKPTSNKFNNTKVLPQLMINKTSNLYHRELARHISEYLMNFELVKSTSMITLQELFANYNRYLTMTQGFGTELIGPQDFNKSIELFEELNLPIKSNTYSKSGLVVMSQKYQNQEFSNIIIQFLAKEEENFKYEKYKSELFKHGELVEEDFDYYLHETYNYFKGNTIADISDHFHWSYGICIEEIDKCLDLGLIVIDQDISGTFYFINKFLDTYTEDDDSILSRVKQDILSEQKQISEQLKMNHDSANNLININPQFQFGIENQAELRIKELNQKHPPIGPSDSLNELAGLQF
ncbi:hypothetical protein HYPBUDRAFT_178116 [Hyphopichia burtonii NRRL Y-1933]|uniref:Vacuolar protein-sorting-associated protein 36 n=1 Tax=Hyphopichia burtonii NRRL Y-1933 TaxID=984485 RepID=A0A1E4RRV0_9ASCO|nr:hypothetical protein HYPBUDRAFT_178116 [Hyphopichia burtonii NRRL Y-1933]ODV70024.1 hypothetical protein HYPBUDRAFT_178116 [Hyphopichia burtonii NRRL Y-1933]